MTDTLFDLAGQVAIVTGTSRGLGQYFARALARAGADLVLTSRNRDSLREFEAEIQGSRNRVDSRRPIGPSSATSQPTIPTSDHRPRLCRSIWSPPR